MYKTIRAGAKAALMTLFRPPLPVLQINRTINRIMKQIINANSLVENISNKIFIDTSACPQ
jgi:hypothetical protein